MRPYRCGQRAAFTTAAVLIAWLPMSVPASGQRGPQRQVPEFTHYTDMHSTSLPMVASPLPDGRSRSAEVALGPYRSVQVNVDAWGLNIVGDASNEPSITVDPNDYRKMAIGWRQFNSPETSDLREAGVGFTRDGGRHWTFPGCLAPGVFGSDPTLASDADGTFYYLSTNPVRMPVEIRLFKSYDGGATWAAPIARPGFYDKSWIAIDRSGGSGRGNIYVYWEGRGRIMRSTDGGQSFTLASDNGYGYGTVTVGPEGEVYAVGYALNFMRSLDAQNPDSDVTFDIQTRVRIGSNNDSYYILTGGSPNRGGLIAQGWVAVDHSAGSSRGNVYLLTLTDHHVDDPYLYTRSVVFVRSTDRGQTWSPPVCINDDFPELSVLAWFPMMSVAPNGRIDVVWNDTRSSPEDLFQEPEFSELYYSYSTDAGETWSPNEPVTPQFNHYVGYPVASPKLGDYYTMVSDNLGVNVAYAATFNGEQDIWFLRIGPYDCNGNDVPDEDDIAAGTSMNCNGNDIPDECEHAPDMNGDGRVNLADYATLQTCFTGPGAPVVDDCCARLDGNADFVIDLTDYISFDESFMK